jgi:hypothetical protein
MPRLDHATCSPEIVAIAARFYAAFMVNSDGITDRGEVALPWEDLGDSVKSHWCAVVVEGERLATYRDLVAAGLSEAEASGTAWPEGREE